jgi:hypothetical protein
MVWVVNVLHDVASGFIVVLQKLINLENDKNIVVSLVIFLLWLSSSCFGSAAP